MASSHRRSQGPGTKETLFSGTVLTLGATVSFVIGVLTALGGRQPFPSARRLLFSGASLIVAAALLAALRLSRNARTALAVTLLSLVVACYVAELYLRWTMTHQLWGLAHALGLPFDPRLSFEVARDLGQHGKEAYPEAHPINLMERTEKEGLLPLSGISKVSTVLCNETGSFVIYTSDEHGFRNPMGIWDGGELQVAAVGDSFTHGMCVEDGLSAVDRIRLRYPRTLNLGVSGDGPLLELATLKEYLPGLRPARVLWFFFEGNDLDWDLDQERKNSILMSYLKPRFRQELKQRQEEVDAVLRRCLTDGTLAAEGEAARRKEMEGLGREFLTLQMLGRSAKALLPGMKPPTFSADLELFGQVLQEASRTASGWGGRLTFVYVPWQARFRDEGYRRVLDGIRERVLSTVQGLDIPHVDLEPIIREKGGLALYVPRPAGHFTPKGYRVVADAVLESLREEEKRPEE